jgi:hypothetical protein
MHNDQRRNMKNQLNRLLTALALCAGWHQAAAQVVLNPNQIQGSLTFTNTNPAILHILNAPDNLGILSGVLFANSLPPAANLSEEGIFNLTTGTNTTPYQITVQSGNPGVAYSVEPRIDVNSNNDVYWFATLNSAPVVSGAAPVTLNFNEGVTVLNFVFVNASDVPVPVNLGPITATLSGGGIQAQYSLGQNNITPGPGVTNRYFMVRGGTNYAVSIQYAVGTNIYSDQVQYQLATNLTAVADQIVTITCLVPGAASTGEITGNVAVTGEFLLTVPGTTPYPTRTVVKANYGPFGNQRWDTVPGSNFTESASGPFALTNLPASASSSPAQGYSVHAEMFFRTNSLFTYFVSPWLGIGLNPAVTVTAGGNVNLSNTFAITPGYIDGSVTLLGPVENGTTNSLLRGVMSAYQDDPEPDGIPSEVDIYGTYGSYMQVSGMDALAHGATLTAVYGYSDPSLQGAFDPTSSAYVGSYEAVVGGLNSQNSLWSPNLLVLETFGGSDLDPATYFDEPVLEITDQRTNASNVEIVAGQRYTNNIAYCFGEVQIGFSSTSGTFYLPEIFEGSGSYTGTDFQGNAANYTVFVEEASGIPVYAGDATNTGLLHMILAQGTYTLTPALTSINPTNGTENFIELAPITVNVGCQQVISLSECLQINVELPTYTSNSPLPVVGTVTSCTNVTLITYQLNGGTVTTVCSSCGMNPGFSFNLDLAAAGLCATNTVVITAHDANGEVSSVTAQIQYNDIAPTVTCPGNIVISCVDSNQAPVTFDVTATSNCGAPVTVVSDPPSGSLFPAGTNLVTSYAVDAYGNKSAPCSFEVIVQSQLLNIQSAIILTWGCGTLQSAATLNGPWSDVAGATSPYVVATTQPHLFYRTVQ